MEIIDDRAGLSHWGSYDAVDHGFDARMQSPFGQERRDVMLPRLPGPVGPDWSALLSASWEPRGAAHIRVLKPAAAQAVIAALALMTPPSTRTAVAQPLSYTSRPNAIPDPNWVQGYLGTGHVLLIDVLTPMSADGSRDVGIVPPVGDASTYVQTWAGGGGRHAVVAGPAQVIDTAAAGGATQPQLPPGCSYSEATGTIVCPPGTQPPTQPPAKAGMTTGTKLALAGAAVVVVALVGGWFAPRPR